MASLLCVPAGAGGPAAASPRRVADPVRGEDAVARPRPTSVTTAVESRPRDGDRRLGGARAWDGVRSTGSLATMAPQAGGQAAGAELQARLQKQLMLIEGRGSVNVDSQMRLVPVSPTPPAPTKGYHWAPSPGTHPQLGFSSGSQARPLVAVPSVQSVPWHGTTEPAGGRDALSATTTVCRSERVSSGAVQRPPQQPSGAPGCGAPQERRLSKPPPPSTPVTPTQPAHPTPRGTPAGTRQGFATMWPGACRDDAQTGASPLRLTTGGRVSVTAAVPEAASRPQRLSAEVGLVARGAPSAPPPTYSRPADAWGVQRPSAEAQLQQLQQELQRERLELQRERLKNEELMHHSSLQGLGQVDLKAYDMIHDQLRQLKLDNSRLCHEVDVLRASRQSSGRNRSMQSSPRASPRGSTCSTSTPRGPQQEGLLRAVEQLQGEKEALAQEASTLREQLAQSEAAARAAAAEASSVREQLAQTEALFAASKEQTETVRSEAEALGSKVSQQAEAIAAVRLQAADVEARRASQEAAAEAAEREAAEQEAALSCEVVALRAAAAEQGAALDAERRRTAALEEQVGALRAAAAEQDVERRRTAALEEEVGALRAAAAEQDAALDAERRRTAALEEQVGALRAAAAEQDAALDAERRRTAALEEQAEGLRAAAAQHAAALEAERERHALHQREATPAPAGAPNAEGQLRAVLTDRAATPEQLLMAIGASEALLEEARRELASKQLRARRAAFERLHAAVEDSDEAGLGAAIEEARRTGVEAEDVGRAVAKLEELSSRTDEQRAEKAAHELMQERKKQAFRLVKQDDAGALAELLQAAGDAARWQEWKDHSGRTLLRFAQELRAAAVLERLPCLLGGGAGPAAAGAAPPAPEGPAKAGPLRRPPLGQPAGASLPALPAAAAAAPAAAAAEAEAAAGGSRVGIGEPRPVTPRAAVGADGAGGADAAGGTTPKVSLAGAGGALQAAPEEEAELKQKAFRAVVQDDTGVLAEVLQRLPEDVWSQWQNKAGKDLLTLSQERGSDGAYSVLAKALGMVNEMKREAFEEREAVWIFVLGEVQPQRATVMEDTPAEADQILVEYWDGDDPPAMVDRCMVRKSNC